MRNASAKRAEESIFFFNLAIWCPTESRFHRIIISLLTAWWPRVEWRRVIGDAALAKSWAAKHYGFCVWCPYHHQHHHRHQQNSFFCRPKEQYIRIIHIMDSAMIGFSRVCGVSGFGEIRLITTRLSEVLCFRHIGRYCALYGLRNVGITYMHVLLDCGLL